VTISRLLGRSTVLDHPLIALPAEPAFMIEVSSGCSGAQSLLTAVVAARRFARLARCRKWMNRLGPHTAGDVQPRRRGGSGSERNWPRSRSGCGTQPAPQQRAAGQPVGVHAPT
jgi:hypothetical protein